MGTARVAQAVTAGVTAVALTTGVGWAQASEPATKPAGDGASGQQQTATSEGDAIVTAEWGDVTKGQEQAATTPKGEWSPAADAGSLYSLTSSLGIREAWAEGITGDHVTVAVIDTGIARVPGLDDKADKVMDGPDLSFDAQAMPTRYVDEFGHGTHMAGIIAGRDEDWDRKENQPDLFTGVAPDAQLLNLKVGSGDGAVDVSQVIAALDWVVQHRKEGGMDVRVVSLAYGTASLQTWQVDPLARAVENAWRAGIVVVVAAGNDGLDAPNLLMPALDPHVLSVGAVDPAGTAQHSDDVVATFTSGGSTERRPDVVAPGRSIASLRVPGSYADRMAPEGRIDGDVSERFFRGSGTSQATAFVAGQVALLLEERPKLTPDQVKAILMSTARPLQASAHPAMGAGVPDVMAAIEAPTPNVTSTLPLSSGTGTLEASRGGEHVVDPQTGEALAGEVDALGQPWSSSAWVQASSGKGPWYKGTWNGRAWTGEKFKKKKWLFQPWAGDSWSGINWETRDPANAKWVARSWRWKGQDWKARSWRQDSWKARSWRALF